MNRLMVDIETVSTKHDAVILSIGLTVFDEKSIIESKYLLPDFLHQLAVGRRIDVETLKWWRDQGEEALSDAFCDINSRKSNVECVKELNELYQKHKCKEIWCQGSDFDVPIIESWMKSYNMNPAWHYGAVRDSRTLRKAFRLNEPKFTGVKHNALADSDYQAERVIECLTAAKNGRLSLALEKM